MSTVLPSIKESSEASEKGNDNHAAQESYLVVRQATGKWPDGTPMELQELVPDGAEILGIELAFAWDTATNKARSIGERVSRNYGELSATEIPATVDLVFRHEGVLTIIDWKSRTRVTSARRNRQIHIQAIACGKLFDATDVVAGLVYLDNWERDLAEFDGFDLEAIATEVAAIMKAAQAAHVDLPPHIGPWCEYCPAQVQCPPRNAMLVSAARLVRTDVDSIASLTDAQAGLLYGQLADLDKSVKKAIAIIKERAERQPLLMGNGKQLAAIECESTKVDAKKCEALLVKNGIPVPVYTSSYVQVRVVNVKKEKEARQANG